MSTSKKQQKQQQQQQQQPTTAVCAVCPGKRARLYTCRHCQARVCFACVFVKRCCGKVPPEHQRDKSAKGGVA